jgi:hypothetical protein
MKRSIIIFFALLLASQISFARSSQNLYSIGNNASWNNPACWSGTQGGPTCMLVPQSNDSIFITSNVLLSNDFTLTNGGCLSINANCSLTSVNNQLIVNENGTIICNGNLNIRQLEAGNEARIKIGTNGKVKLLNDFINNSTFVTVDGTLEVAGTLQNSNQQGNSSISGKGTITSGIFSGSGSVLGITNISLIPLQSSITECTWTGAHSEEWTDPKNWNYNLIPVSGQRISVLASRAFNPTINSNVICSNLLVNSAASVVISA